MFKHIIQLGLRPPEGGKPLSQAVDPFGDRLTQLFSLYVFLYAQHSLGMAGRQERIMKVIPICIIFINTKKMAFITQTRLSLSLLS